MEMILIILGAAIGTTLGAAAGVWMMQRRGRPHAADAELSLLYARVQSSESSLTAALAGAEDLRRQIAERDQELEKVHGAGDTSDSARQIETLTAEVERANAEVERVNAEAAAERADLEEQLNEAKASVEQLTGERNHAGEEAVQRLTEVRSELGARIEALEAQLDSERERSRNLAGEHERAAGEAGETLVHLRAQVDAEQQRGNAAEAEVARLTGQIATQQRERDSVDSLCNALEAQLREERARTERLLGEVDAAHAERTRWEARVEEEKRSVAKGVELLAMAQGLLAGLAGDTHAPKGNGNGHLVRVAAPTAGDEEPEV